jgi:hypothetical protein
MESLTIEATRSTPRIYFDSNSHIHDILGESYPENSFEFYEPVMSWLVKYLSQLSNDNKVIFNFDIIYFNSSSSKIFMDMFDMFEEASANGNHIIVNWLYDEDNEATLEYGEDFKEDFTYLDFCLVEKV